MDYKVSEITVCLHHSLVDRKGAYKAEAKKLGRHNYQFSGSVTDGLLTNFTSTIEGGNVRSVT